MSHTVTITRTTRTTTGTEGSLILLNTGYFTGLNGLLKLFQTILGAVCVGIVSYYIDRNLHYYYLTQSIFFLIVTAAFLIGTFCLVISSMMSLSTASILPKTLFEVVYHIVAFALYLAASITLLVQVNQNKRTQEYEAYLAAAIIGLVNTGLYLFSAVLAIRFYRGVAI